MSPEGEWVDAEAVSIDQWIKGNIESIGLAPNAGDRALRNQ